MNCEAFLDRLYDDDVRAAGRGLGDMPPDVAAHVRTCDACLTAYDSACADDRLLTRALPEAPTPAWRADVLQRMARPTRASWLPAIATANAGIVRGVLAVAAAQIVLGQHSIFASIAAFSAGAATAILGPGLTRHWEVLRRTA